MDKLCMHTNGTFCRKECEQFTPNATTDIDLETQYRMKTVDVEQNKSS